MNKKFLFVAYREWAEITYQNLIIEVPYITETTTLLEHLKENADIEHIFFVGWSEIIPKNIIENYKCYCIHPSKLPHYRGGSPLQHQIINDVKNSAVTLFQMNEKIDAGPIIDKTHLSLSGTLDDILTRVSILSSVLINSLIYKIMNNISIQSYCQDESEATFFKRRTQSQSEITFLELETKTSLYLHNKIRALNDPYPNAYIRCIDGKKLFIKKSSLL